MKRVILILTIILIFTACGILTYTAYRDIPQGNPRVVVRADGKTVCEENLNTADCQIPIENGDCKNIVRIENGGVSMIYADCPDKLCVKQGVITSEAYPIVCLPNKVTVEIIGENSPLDAVSR